MCAPLHNPPLFDDQYLAGLPDGAEPVRNDEGRPPMHQFAQALLDEGLAFGVQVGSRFIQDDDLGVGQYGAGDGDALPLPAGKLDAPLADQRIQAVFEAVGEFVDVGGPDGLLQLLLRGLRPGEEDILPYGALE